MDIQENRDQILMEATRLARANYFVERFLAEAKRQDVDVEHGTLLGFSILPLLLCIPETSNNTGIRVTAFKLAVEIVPSSGPSAASGFSLEQYEAAQPPSNGPAASEHDSTEGIIVWLFEPRRSSKVKHWSGTNEYPSWKRNKVGSTLSAFTHYAYITSHESTVFCDLQSKFCVVHHFNCLTEYNHLQLKQLLTRTEKVQRSCLTS